MEKKLLLIEHSHNGHLVKSKLLKKAKRPFVMGSSLLCDLKLLGENVFGVHAVIEYRHPHWYVMDCCGQTHMVHQEAFTEHKILGGEHLQIGNHEIKLTLATDSLELFKTNKKVEGHLNAHQVAICIEDEVIRTEFLPVDAVYHFELGGAVKELAAPKDDNWVVTKLGKFAVKQRLTHKPEANKRPRPHLSIVKDPDLRSAVIATSTFCFMVIMTAVFLQKHEEVSKPESNKFVQMIYDSKVVEKMKQEAKQLTKKRFAAPAQAVADQPNVSNKREVVTKVIKNIKTAGLTDLISKISKRASLNAVKIQAMGKTADVLNTSRAIASIGSRKTGNEKDLSGQKFKLGGVKTDGKAGGSGNYKNGTDLTTTGVGNGNVEVDEEETIVDGGLDKEVISEFIKTKLGQIRYCYERQLSAQPDLHGKVLVKFTIVADGGVKSETVAKTTLNSANVEACMLRRIAGWNFPKPKGGTSVIVSYPFLFKSVN